MSFRQFTLHAAFVVTFAASAPALAQIRSFVVPANDGYGLSECLAEGGACGHEMAEAWCNANGLSKALSFGRVTSTDVTGSIASDTPSQASDSFIVMCDD